MRCAYSAVVTLLAVWAVPSASATQQMLTLFDNPFHDQHLDHAVPVATVSSIGDIVALGNARIVQDASGEPFILGTGTMNVTNPFRPRIGFTMTNTTQQPIQLSDVFIEATTMVAENEGSVRYLSTLEGQAASPWGNEQLQAGATVSVDMPIPAPYDRKDGRTWGFIVLVEKYPGPDRAAWERGEKLLSKAFLALTSGRSRGPA
jgi:hypothetical protein